MKVTAKIVGNYEDNGRLKAIAVVKLDGVFLITGVRIVDCEKGLTVFMPSRKIEDGSYKDICFPITPGLHRKISDAVLAAYAAPPEGEPEEQDDEPPQGE